MRQLTLAVLLFTACDPRSYPVGTAPAADAAAGSAATGGTQGTSATGGTGGTGTGGMALPAVAACSVPEGVLVDRPLNLYPELLADRLAHFLWARGADAELLAQAKLVHTSGAVRALAASMTADSRFADGVDALEREWLGMEEAVTGFGGADEVRAQVDAGLRASMLIETTTFVRDLFTAGDGRLSTLLTASYTFANGRLAPLYGLPEMPGAGFSRVQLDERQRSGILTQASLLFSKPRISGRGTWVQNKLLCLGVPVPPATHLDPPLRQPGETGRQALERETANPGACTACHLAIDPPGYAFEHFDALGRWRDDDNGKPIDVSGTLEYPSEDPPLKFDGVRQLAQQLSGSCRVQRCMVQVFLQHALASPDAGSPAERDDLLRAFVASGLDLRALFTHVAASPSFLAP
jgi:hypothetical protein